MNRIRIDKWIPGILAVFLMAFLSAPDACPWGRTGHRLAAKTAQDRLTPKALAAVRDILGPESSLLDIAKGDDEQKEIPAEWGLVHSPVTESGFDRSHCAPAGCAVDKIRDFRRILQNPKAPGEEKQRALKFLVHLIADLHQPLHVGDAGNHGAGIQVRYFNRDACLHEVWDSLIIEHYSTYEGVWLWEITGEAAPDMKALWSNGTPEDWATESLKAAGKAYCLPGETTVMKSGSILGDEYTGGAVPIIRRQLAKAGVRIAWVLNEIFR